MGIFSHKHEEPASQAPHPPVQAAVEKPPTQTQKRGSIFHRNRDDSPTGTHRTSATNSTSGSAPTSPNMAQSESPTIGSSTFRSHNFLQRGGGMRGSNDIEMDPSIVEAREHVLNAEAAEREADRKLAESQAAASEARTRVQAAHEHVEQLLRGFEEEQRLAKIKAFHVQDISKRSSLLGRH